MQNHHSLKVETLSLGKCVFGICTWLICPILVLGYIFLLFLKGFAKAQKEAVGVRWKAKFFGKSNEVRVLKVL